MSEWLFALFRAASMSELAELILIFPSVPENAGSFLVLYFTQSPTTKAVTRRPERTTITSITMAEAIEPSKSMVEPNAEGSTRSFARIT